MMCGKLRVCQKCVHSFWYVQTIESESGLASCILLIILYYGAPDVRVWYYANVIKEKNAYRNCWPGRWSCALFSVSFPGFRWCGPWEAPVGLVARPTRDRRRRWPWSWSSIWCTTKRKTKSHKQCLRLYYI